MKKTAFLLMVSELKRDYDAYWSDRVPGVVEYTRYLLTYDTDFNHTLRLFIRNVPVETKVLDMGTGCGLVALEMARMGFDTTGIDCNPDMIEAAKQIAKDMKLDVDFRVGDVTDIDLPERSFGLITARNCLWNLEDPVKAYAKWKSLLKPGG